MLALLDLGRKFSQRDDHAMIIDLGLSGQDIADLVECSRPKVSECLKKLVAEGVVTREHRRFIIDSVKFRLAYDPDACRDQKEDLNRELTAHENRYRIDTLKGDGCARCIHSLRYADARTWKWFREYRDRLSQGR